MRSLYQSSVFNSSEEGPAAAAGELSKLKMREVKGHDIFNSSAAPEVHTSSGDGKVSFPLANGSSFPCCTARFCLSLIMFEYFIVLVKSSISQAWFVYWSFDYFSIQKLHNLHLSAYP